MWRSIDVAWLAGLIEGEGSFSVHKNRYHVNVAMTDQDVIQKCLGVVGLGYVGGPYGPYKSASLTKKPSWRWSVANREHVYAVCAAVYSFMGLRRKTRIREIMNAIIGSRYNRKRVNSATGKRHGSIVTRQGKHSSGHSTTSNQ